MAYYAHTHEADKIARNKLFRLNGIPYEEMLENLSILLGDEEHESTSTIANLPTNKDVYQSLVENENLSANTIELNKLCIV